MSEFIFELYSEEIPSSLQTNARDEIKNCLENFFKAEKLKFKKFEVLSTPTRLSIMITGLPLKMVFPSKEIRGPKKGVIEDILNNFLRSHNVAIRDAYLKSTDKGEFYFIKTFKKEVLIQDVIMKTLLNTISSIKWKKSMRWSDTEMIWGRPLRSIMAIFNGKLLSFKYGHIRSTNTAIIEKDLIRITKKIKNIKEYLKFLKNNSVILDHEERKRIIIKSFEKICSSRRYLNRLNTRVLNEVVNIVDNPNVLLAEFNKRYLELPFEIITSTLESHQRYFPLFISKEKLSNKFLLVTNKIDNNRIIRNGNQKVIEARLADAKFFWDKDKSKNLIKQVSNLKNIIFYEKLGSVYQKTQRLRLISGWIADEINLNKEKVELAASISKSDLCSDLIGEYPELQGKLGRYFSLAQGFDEQVADAISEHYLPIGNNSKTSNNPISYSISIADKIDTLVGFYLIGERPTSSKDPYALRRAAIGILRNIIDNKINIKVKDLISYNIKIFKDQGVEIKNENANKEILIFLRERMKNILKDKNIKNDIIDASISSHNDDNFLSLFKKNIITSKFIKKDIGTNLLSSYKRAFNIIGKEPSSLEGRPDTILFRKDEEKNLFEKINEIKKMISDREDNKDIEKVFLNLSEIKSYTDNFFDNVKVNDENIDIKNNRLELLKMYCNTFNSFINFSKLEGVS